jgi:outer membrane lipoprotein-sorting protein
MRYVLSLLMLPAWLSLASAQDNDAEKLFRDMEKKIKAAKAFEVTFVYQVENKKTKGELLLTKDNKARLKVSGAFGDKRNASFELVADGRQLRTKGAKMFVGSNGQSGLELGGESEWETPKNFHDLLSATVSRGGVWFTVLVMPYFRAGENEIAPDNMKINAYDFKLGDAEKVGDGEAKVVRYRFGKGDGCRGDEEITLWIDAKTLLPLKRSFTLKIDRIRVTETYNEFKLDPKVDAKAFELPK